MQLCLCVYVCVYVCVYIRCYAAAAVSLVLCPRSRRAARSPDRDGLRGSAAAYIVSLSLSLSLSRLARSFSSCAQPELMIFSFGVSSVSCARLKQAAHDAVFLSLSFSILLAVSFRLSSLFSLLGFFCVLESGICACKRTRERDD